LSGKRGRVKGQRYGIFSNPVTFNLSPTGKQKLLWQDVYSSLLKLHSSIGGIFTNSEILTPVYVCPDYELEYYSTLLQMFFKRKLDGVSAEIN
jgi:hypothetical protein